MNLSSNMQINSFSKDIESCKTSASSNHLNASSKLRQLNPWQRLETAVAGEKLGGTSIPRCPTTLTPLTLGSHFLYTALHLGANSTEASLSVYIPIIPEPFGHFGRGIPLQSPPFGVFPSAG